MLPISVHFCCTVSPLLPCLLSVSIIYLVQTTTYPPSSVLFIICNQFLNLNVSSLLSFFPTTPSCTVPNFSTSIINTLCYCMLRPNSLWDWSYFLILKRSLRISKFLFGCPTFLKVPPLEITSWFILCQFSDTTYLVPLVNIHTAAADKEGFCSVK